MQYTLLACFLLMTLLTGAQTKIKVACVGDSITEGGDLEEGERYPEQLQLLTGDAYEVRNYGVGGRTMLRKGDFSYWQEEKYQQVLAWNPDVVIIKLGTNDSKPQNWIYGEEFEGDYRKFIQSFKKLPGSRKIYICTPVPVFQDLADIEKSVVEGEIVPLVKKVGAAEKVTVIDLYTSFLGKDGLFPDGVHPNAAGAKAIADTIYGSIKK